MELTCSRVKPGAEYDTVMADSPGGEQVHVDHAAQDPQIDTLTDAGDQDSEPVLESDEITNESESEEEEDFEMGSDADVDADADADSDAEDESEDGVDGIDEIPHAADPAGRTPVRVFRMNCMRPSLKKVPQYSDFYKDPSDDDRSIFVDFDDSTDADPETDSAGSASETDSDFNDGDEYYMYHALYQDMRKVGPFETYPRRTQAHLGEPAWAEQRLRECEQALNHEQRRAARLTKMRRYAEAEGQASQQRVIEICASIASNPLVACAVSDVWSELRREYAAFMESLEPRFGSRGGWSVTCFGDHGGSYVGYDPDLELFRQSAEMPLGSCNFRCEASVIGKTFTREQEG